MLESVLMARLLNFIIEPELLQRIDNWRFKYHFQSRAAAVKWLLKFALDQKPKPEDVG